MQAYSLICRNDSMMNTQFCVFQRFKKDASAASLAWICQTCAARASTRFEWTDELYFIWGYSQKLHPGENLFTVQAESVRDAENVQLGLRDDVFSLQSVVPATVPGKLMLTTDATVPGGMMAVGLGMKAECMCGTAALAVRAGPNSSYLFEQEIEYYLTSVPSRKLRTGDVLDMNTLNAVKIPFSAGRTQITAQLDESNRLSFITAMLRSRPLG